ncbi:hypothetical protein CQA57_04945 [Helicobacter anseris]|uniref:Uncharacterized protein n=1 Tax=Helicobacter anseris TaxID=375926 RepID=A0A3D8J9I0_9HELI|nr:hypothetical protein [Helicobacter anseris]RDU73531.1 hypothetical protein CQA57_04945 [Helicobacter anseris]
MNWHDKLKVAILNNNTQEVYQLIVDIPKENLKTIEDLLSAQTLISQGIEMLERDKQELQKQMLQIKLAQKFLE